MIGVGVTPYIIAYFISIFVPDEPRKIVKGLPLGHWHRKADWVWRQANGPIPEEHMVLILDGDMHNLAIDNLACVPSRIFKGIIYLTERGSRR